MSKLSNNSNKKQQEIQKNSSSFETQQDNDSDNRSDTKNASRPEHRVSQVP